MGVHSLGFYKRMFGLCTHLLIRLFEKEKERFYFPSRAPSRRRPDHPCHKIYPCRPIHVLT